MRRGAETAQLLTPLTPTTILSSSPPIDSSRTIAKPAYSITPGALGPLQRRTVDDAIAHPRRPRGACLDERASDRGGCVPPAPVRLYDRVAELLIVPL